MTSDIWRRTGAIWEYLELATADITNGFDVPTFNSLGDEGWELATVYLRPGGLMNFASLVAVFKRPRGAEEVG